MGTAIRVELWCEDEAGGQAAIDAVMAEMHRIDRTMSPHKPASELSRINRDAHREAVPLSNEMFLLLVQAQRFAQLSQGAFDITFASVGNLYDYREGVAPDAASLARARAAVGWRGLELDARTRSVKFAHEGCAPPGTTASAEDLHGLVDHAPGGDRRARDEPERDDDPSEPREEPGGSEASRDNDDDAE